MRVPFGRYRGAEVADLGDDYLAWLASLPTFEVKITEKKKRELRAAVADELQRRLDERPELQALVLDTHERISGTGVSTALH